MIIVCPHCDTVMSYNGYGFICQECGAEIGVHYASQFQQYDRDEEDDPGVTSEQFLTRCRAGGDGTCG